jgi:hypothetical protein
MLDFMLKWFNENCVPSKSRTYFRAQKRPEVESKSDTSQERLESNLLSIIQSRKITLLRNKKRKEKESTPLEQEQNGLSKSV